MDTKNTLFNGITDEELVCLAGNGDSAALEYIMCKYAPVARNAARGYYVPGADREDLEQEGMIGLYKAVIGYDNSRQSRFYFFAKLCAERQVCSAVKTALRGKHTPLNQYRDSYDDCADRTERSPEDIVISREDKASLEAVMSRRLSPFEGEALQMFVKGWAYADIAKELGCSRKAVDNALRRVRMKLKKQGASPS